MGAETLLDDKTILQNVSVTVSGFTVPNDDLITIETKQSTTFGIYGTIRIKDSFNLNNSGLVLMNGNTRLVIQLTDKIGTKSVRTYVVTSVNTTPDGTRFRSFNITFVDVVTFTLSNTYISKGFTGTVSNAFLAFVDELKILDLLNADQLTLDVQPTRAVSSFVVPQDISVLEFFIERFALENVRMYVDRYGIHVREIDIRALTIRTGASGAPILYSNIGTNQMYLYGIHDYEGLKNQTGVITGSAPERLIFRHDVNNELQYGTLNVRDELPLMSTNTLQPDIPATTGVRYETQAQYATDNQRYELFDALINNNTIYAAVPGDLKNTLMYTLVDVTLRGNIMTSESISKGDILDSGKYIITAVSDKIIMDKLIHKLTFSRVDARKPR